MAESVSLWKRVETIFKGWKKLPGVKYGFVWIGIGAGAKSWHETVPGEWYVRRDVILWFNLNYLKKLIKFLKNLDKELKRSLLMRWDTCCCCCWWNRVVVAWVASPVPNDPRRWLAVGSGGVRPTMIGWCWWKRCGEWWRWCWMIGGVFLKSTFESRIRRYSRVRARILLIKLNQIFLKLIKTLTGRICARLLP